MWECSYRIYSVIDYLLQMDMDHTHATPNGFNWLIANNCGLWFLTGFQWNIASVMENNYNRILLAPYKSQDYMLILFKGIGSR